MGHFLMCVILLIFQHTKDLCVCVCVFFYKKFIDNMLYYKVILH